MNDQTAVVVPGATPPRGAYPHVKVVGDLIFVSGTSSRRPDNTIAGVTVGPDGVVKRDVAVQTAAVLDNIALTLAAVGATLADVVDITSFLVDMDDFVAYNEVYATYFTQAAGPARTTVAVHQLPHPDLVIEIKAIAYRPDART